MFYILLGAFENAIDYNMTFKFIFFFERPSSNLTITTTAAAAAEEEEETDQGFAAISFRHVYFYSGVITNETGCNLTLEDDVEEEARK